MRQVFLDTETTGLEVTLGHRLIELACVEYIDRRPTGRVLHKYVNPGREIDPGAVAIHGITNEFLDDKPLFADVAHELVDFVRDAELVIHNAVFDIGFLNAELGRLPGYSPVTDYCAGVCDTLLLARRMNPGQRCSLDALCKRLGVDNSQRTLHGALLDAEILADVYLAMTGGQTALSLGGESVEAGGEEAMAIRRLPPDRPALKVLPASEDECARHEAMVRLLDKAAGGTCLWSALAGESGQPPLAATG